MSKPESPMKSLQDGLSQKMQISQEWKDISQRVICESGLSEIEDNCGIDERMESELSECTGITIQKHHSQFETNKNGVFHQDFKLNQSFDPALQFQIPQSKKQHSQKQSSEIFYQQSYINSKLSSKQLFQKNTEVSQTLDQEQQKSISDKYEQLQDQFLNKKIYDFIEIKNEKKNGELQENKNEKEIYGIIISPQPTKYQKIGRNDEQRGDPICPAFQIEESNILKVNQNIINVPSKIRNNFGQKKQLDIQQKQDRQDFKNCQNIDNQVNYSTRNQKQFERNGKSFILKKQSNIIQKLLNQTNLQVDIVGEKQRLNVQKELKISKQVDSSVGQKTQMNQDDAECNQQFQELKIPVIEKNNEENDSHKSNSNRKSDQSIQNQNCEINAFTYQVTTDLDDYKNNHSKFSKNQPFKIANIEKFKEQVAPEDQQSNMKDVSLYGLKSQNTNQLNEAMNLSINSWNTLITSTDIVKNDFNQVETKNNIKSPLKDKIKIENGIKRSCQHPTDPQAERINRTSKNQGMQNELMKNQSSHESSSTQDFSRVSDIQKSLLSSTNNLVICESQLKIENRQPIFDYVFENEDINGYNHSFSSKQFMHDNNQSNEQIEILPKCQKMKSHYLNEPQNDLIMPVADKKVQNCFDYQKFNLNRIGDGLLQKHQTSPTIDFIEHSNEDIEMNPDFVIKRNSFGRCPEINQNQYFLLEKFDFKIKSRQQNKIKSKQQFKKIQKNIEAQKNEKIYLSQNKTYEQNINFNQFQQENKGNEKNDSDRFIPIRVCDETINEIFNIQITNNHEQALINKLSKMKKQASVPDDQQNNQQAMHNQTSQNIQNRLLSDRGLYQNQISDIQAPQNEQSLQDMLISSNQVEQEYGDLQIDNRLSQEEREEQTTDFNNTFFQTIIQRRQSQRQQELVNQNLGMLLQQAGVSRGANASDSQNPLEIYQNIFGVQNSFDQVIKQVTQNASTTNTLPLAQSQANLHFEGGPILNDYQLNILNEYHNNIRSEVSNGNNIQGNQHKNHAQEEKDMELNKNISNYNNLIEQNLLIKNLNFKNNETISCIDTTHSSNLIMTNLTSDSISSSQGIPFISKSLSLNQQNKPQDSAVQAQNSTPIYNQQISVPVNQKSILGGKILKFKSKDHNIQKNQDFKAKKKFFNKQNYDYDYNLNGFINCDQIFLNERNQNIEESVVNTVRKIPSNPYRILEAPGLCDDFYLNLVDWSSQNLLAVALESSVFVWNATTSTVQELCDLGQADQVTSLSWSQKGNHLSVGTKSGQVQIWDINAQKKIRSLEGHFARVSSIAWNNVNTSIVASGSKDRSILIRDLRAHNNQYSKLMDHKQEVCGLRWSLHDENQLASGGNDNQLFIWSDKSDQPLAKFSDHQAAVKAINWSPLHRGLLATGGGTADQCIRFWNTINLSSINCINTGSQVCNLVFSKTNDELVSTHGYSLNQVIVWKYPTMEKIATLTGHTFRVLYLAMNPDGSSIVTGAGDERLRFWNIFPKARSSKIGPLGGLNVVGSVNSSLYPSNLDIR